MASSDSVLFDDLSRSNINSVWGAVTMEVLARLGVETVVTSPGSRSTPLTVAAVRNRRIEALSFLDERSAAFFALGLAKRTHRPVALVCTSGSALANYYPAVVEAFTAGVPLLLLTTDRPPELQACRSGQTIDQLKFFGDYVLQAHQLALPELDLLGYLRQTLVHACVQSNQMRRGPIHLNFAFRDPLPPSLEGKPVCSESRLREACTVIARAAESTIATHALDPVVLERLASHTNGVITVGEYNPSEGDEAFSDAVAMLAHKLGWPVLSDALNPIRNHSGENGAIVSTYDYILRDEARSASLRPTAILQIGQLPTSKVLRSWLSELDAVSFLLTEMMENTDPLHRVALPIYGSVSCLADAIHGSNADPVWLDQWMTSNQTAEIEIENRIDSLDAFFEGKVCSLLSRNAPIGSSVFLANSMSVRYAEFFWSAGNRAISIHCNRGANGIDGTLSTAMGVAHRGRSTLLVTGDLAFLHDSNAMLGLTQMTGSLTVVLVNNNGGGIFEHLPISENTEVFESHFATPQTVDFATLCSSHGVGHQMIRSWQEFVEKVSELPERGLQVLEISTNRKADKQTLREILSN